MQKNEFFHNGTYKNVCGVDFFRNKEGDIARRESSNVCLSCKNEEVILITLEYEGNTLNFWKIGNKLYSPMLKSYIQGDFIKKIEFGKIYISDNQDHMYAEYTYGSSHGFIKVSADNIMLVISHEKSWDELLYDGEVFYAFSKDMYDKWNVFDYCGALIFQDPEMQIKVKEYPIFYNKNHIVCKFRGNDYYGIEKIICKDFESGDFYSNSLKHDIEGIEVLSRKIMKVKSKEAIYYYNSQYELMCSTSLQAEVCMVRQDVSIIKDYDEGSLVSIIYIVGEECVTLSCKNGISEIGTYSLSNYYRTGDNDIYYIDTSAKNPKFVRVLGNVPDLKFKIFYSSLGYESLYIIGFESNKPSYVIAFEILLEGKGLKLKYRGEVDKFFKSKSKNSTICHCDSNILVFSERESDNRTIFFTTGISCNVVKIRLGLDSPAERYMVEKPDGTYQIF